MPPLLSDYSVTEIIEFFSLGCVHWAEQARLCLVYLHRNIQGVTSTCQYIAKYLKWNTSLPLPIDTKGLCCEWECMWAIPGEMCVHPSRYPDHILYSDGCILSRSNSVYTPVLVIYGLIVFIISCILYQCLKMKRSKYE